MSDKSIIVLAAAVPTLVAAFLLTLSTPMRPWWLALLALGTASLTGVVAAVRLRARTAVRGSRPPYFCVAPHCDCAIADYERQRLGRELHDEIGQSLSVLRLDLGWLQRRSGAFGVEIGERLRAMTEVIDHTAQSLRHITNDLESGAAHIAELGLIPAVEQIAANVQRCAPVRVQIDAPDDLTTIPGHVAYAAYRVVQESLTNVLRHADASEVTVRLAQEENALKLQVRDNGRGFERAQIPQLARGLRGMQARIDGLGGCFDLVTAPGKGTSILAAIPLALLTC